MNRNCGNCVSWKRIESKTEGHCKRNPPVVIPISDDAATCEELLNGITVWPITKEDDYCGKHFHKEGY